jgi:Helix-turn-helix domain
MLARVFGCARVVFNDALRVREEAYRCGIKLSDSEIQRRVITQAKGTSERAWLCEVPSVALVQSVNDSRRAWRNFFDSATGKRKGGRVGRPRMKSRKDHRQSFRLTRNGFRVRPGGRLFVAKVGEVRVRWSRELPSAPSSVTIIREPDGHYYASFVVDVAATPLPVVQREAGVDVGLARLATIATTDDRRHDVANPKHLGRKQRKAAPVGAGEIPPAERISQQGQDAAQDRHRAQRGGPGSAGLSPQAGFGVGSREPSDPRREPQHRGYGQKPPARPSNLRRWVGPVRADHRRESRPLRTHPSSRVAVASVEQDMLGVRALPRRAPATGTPVDLPDLRRGPRQRPQRRQSHSRRRAGGETNRLWSPWKTATRCGGGR